MKKIIIDEVEYVPKEKEIETWTDPETELIWEKLGSKKKMSWNEALAYAKTLGNGWRLPTIQELLSLIDFSENNPACKINGTYSSYYWSSTIYANDMDDAWHVDFYDGDMGYSCKGNSYYVRCIKEGDNYVN